MTCPVSHVFLTPDDVRLVEWVGTEREDRAASRGWDPNSKGDDNPYERHKIGAAAEFAVALALGVTWQPSLEPDKAEGDVRGLHVRGTELDHGHLLINKPIAEVGKRDGDPDGIFVLVTGRRPCLAIRGWITSDLGRDRSWWRRPPGRRRFCYMAPQTSLRPLAIRARTERPTYKLPAASGYPARGPRVLDGARGRS